MYLKEEDTLFSGDCVLGEGSVVFEDLIVYLQSLNKILSLNAKKIYPGHGPVVEDPTEKVNSYISKRLEREAHIIDALSMNAGGFMSAMDIVKHIYEVCQIFPFFLCMDFSGGWLID